MTDDIEVEWNMHQSKFSRAWRSSMEKKRKVVPFGNPSVAKLIRRIQALPANAGEKKALKKDALLIVAAQASSRVVVSLDDQARRLFEQHAEQLRTPRDIRWLNPEFEQAIHDLLDLQ